MPFQNRVSTLVELASYYLIDSDRYFNEASAFLTPDEQGAIKEQARSLAKQYRLEARPPTDFEQLMAALPLDSPQGKALFHLAESFLRTGTSETRKRLIEDAFSPDIWDDTPEQATPTFMVNMVLLLSRWVSHMTHPSPPPSNRFQLLEKAKQFFLSEGLEKVLSHLAQNFVAAETIESAILAVQEQVRDGYSHTFDMLGEAALNLSQAENYYQKYASAIRVLGESARDCFRSPPEISIKLSALDPNYHVSKWSLCQPRLSERLNQLCQLAHEAHVAITFDAEEAHRLVPQLLLIEQLLEQKKLSPNGELGLAVQAYQKRALPVLSYLDSLCKRTGQRLHVRLVKGAYWDTEIRFAQKSGLPDYPVFSQKADTDLNYLLCTKALLQSSHLTGQFASHNLVSLAGVVTLAKAAQKQSYEIQKLYGMGNAVHDLFLHQSKAGSRVYTPIGEYQSLLPYLVRRLLENGVNSSFIHLYQSPAFLDNLDQELQRTFESKPPRQTKSIPLPPSLYLPERKNSPGKHIECMETLHFHLDRIKVQTAQLKKTSIEAFSLISGKPQLGTPKDRFSPIDGHLKIGRVHQSDELELPELIATSRKGQNTLKALPLGHRTTIIQRFTRLILENEPRLTALIMLETGKTLKPVLDEIRELIDYCHYYSAQATQLLNAQTLRAPAGELNRLRMEPRGIVLCISPWNFPAAIFAGQIIAAWLTGNSVIAKPSTDTPLTAYYLTELMLESGFPPETLQLLLITSDKISELISHPAISLVVFTGSWPVARSINLALAQRQDQLCPLIAETGGLNAMICDSSALPEQVIQDALTSAFDSAGQRCSALRVLAVPKQLLAYYRTQLALAMKCMVCGSPFLPETDCGPVINSKQHKVLSDYLNSLAPNQRLYQVPVSAPSAPDSLFSRELFFPPTLVEINTLTEMKEEIFGPILHLTAYDEPHILNWIDQLNKTGFGLTFGIHSRSPSRIREIASQVRIGNIYVNQPIIGATVGSQPFGGVGLSGTGPKAGGPNYLTRFCYEKVISENEAAAGGNPSLFNRV